VSRKTENLKQQGTWNRQAESVQDPLFQRGAFFDAEDLVQVKYEMLRRVEVEHSSVTESASAFGFSRLTFYQTKQAFHREGLYGLVPKKRGPRKPHKLSPEVVTFARELLEQEPSLGWQELAHRVRAQGAPPQHRAIGAEKKTATEKPRRRGAGMTTPSSWWRRTSSCAWRRWAWQASFIGV
jgi:transposase